MSAMLALDDEQAEIGFSANANGLRRASSSAVSPDPHSLILSGSVATQTFTSNRWFDHN